MTFLNQSAGAIRNRYCPKYIPEVKNGQTIEAAWLALLADMGVTSPTAAAPPRHPLVAALLKIAPEPESEKMAENYAVLRAIIPA